VVSLLRESSSISNKANCCHDQHGYDRSRFEEQICQRHGNISGISEAGAGRKSCPEFRHQLFQFWLWSQRSYFLHREGNSSALFFSPDFIPTTTKPSDTSDKIDAVDGARVVELVANVVQGLDALNEKPQYVKVAEPAHSEIGGGSGYGPYFESIPDFAEVEHGVKFSDLRDGSPAAKAGLKAGDILIELMRRRLITSTTSHTCCAHINPATR
jgi:hypothetical protein